MKTPAPPPAAPTPAASEPPVAGAEPFWRAKPLSAMTAAEWESLCDGCGRCCLVKLEDEDSGAVAYTDVVCRLFDERTCRCADYENRSEQVSDCVRLTPEVLEEIGWLPPTCAYRLVSEGRDLPFWHPLVSGTRQSVADAGISVAGRIGGPETAFGLFELVDHIVSWPVRWPKGAKGVAGATRPSRRRAPRSARGAPGANPGKSDSGSGG